MAEIEIKGTPYVHDDRVIARLGELADRVKEMRRQGKLTEDVLHRIRKFFRIKNIYHSDAIEGNKLTFGETQLVVARGLTLTGKSLKDQAEARNLSHALDFLEKLAGSSNRAITETDVRSLNDLVLRGIHDEAGSYRTVEVKISGSEYAVPSPENVVVEMQEYCRWLSRISIPSAESFASVDGFLAAGVAHTWFVMIHPFIDGNGRVARLLQNLILMRYGYPIAIITTDDRERYYDALEIAQTSDLTPLLILLAECLEESLEEWELAAVEQEQQSELIKRLSGQVTERAKMRTHNEFEVWKSAMELLKSYFRQTVTAWNAENKVIAIYLHEYSTPEFEKYFALSNRVSVKRTWFFRLDFTHRESTVRYLFFFGYATPQMHSESRVVLHVAREEPAKSFHYEKLDHIIGTNVPDIREIGYVSKKEQFAVRRHQKVSVQVARVEKLGRDFFESVIANHFSA